jgi:hypothetical protein
MWPSSILPVVASPTPGSSSFIHEQSEKLGLISFVMKNMACNANVLLKIVFHNNEAIIC